MSHIVHKHSHYCMSLCGSNVTVKNNAVLSVEPDRENPFTWRDLCRKGKTRREVRRPAGNVKEHPERLLTPMKRVGDHYVEATYDEAIAE